MAFVGTKPNIGLVDLSSVATTLGTPGNSQLPSVTLEPQLGEIITGWDPNLGSGEFIYLKAAATIAQYTVCELAYSITGGYLTITATPWAGATNSGKPLAVALNPMTAGQFSWFQIAGPAIALTNGTDAAGPVYWQATGVVSSTGLNSRQMLNASIAMTHGQTLGQGNSAVTLSSTQAILFIDRPFAQGQTS
jgi:hypothetical protein